MINNQGEISVKKNERWLPMLLKGLPLASIATLLILFFCNSGNPDKNKSNARDEMKVMEQAQDKAALNISIPPLDKIVPIRTETATFALG
ncbi:MAG: hypothetical protein ACQEQO_00985 [Thermodesulfobacteriota bacterium]